VTAILHSRRRLCDSAVGGEGDVMTWIHRGLACAVATLASGAFAAAADTFRPVDVTRCGQFVRRGEVGTLRADLHCAAAESSLGLTADGILVDFGATLRLGGFTISGDGSGFGVECSSQGGRRRGWCVVEGPGEITNFFNGIDGGGGRVRLRNVTVHRNRNGMQYKAPYVIELFGVVMSDNAELGMTSRGGIIRGSDVETSRNGVVGIMGPIARIARLTAMGNGRLGGAYVQRRGAARIVDSVITGNDGLGAGLDVLSIGPVKLRNTTCGRGARIREVLGGVETTTVLGKLPCAAN